jgi:heptosyltransferase-3
LKILFIKLKNIGDALLLTPAIAATRKKFPDATLWVWVRKGSEGILEGCDGIDHILTTSATDTYYNRMSSLLNDWSNLRSVRRLGFDAVFEFSESSRGRWLAAFSGSKLSAISSTDAIPPGWRLFYDVFRARDGCECHRVIKDYRLVRDVLGLPEQVPPLQFSRTSANFEFVEHHQLHHHVVIHPCTRWKRKSWRLENWVKLCQYLHDKGLPLVLSCGPSSEEVAFCQTIAQKSGVNPILTGGKLLWKDLAGILYTARLFVGVDTAAMHLAAACQTPIVALFGPSVESAWHPWACRYRLVTPVVSEGDIRRKDGWLDVRLRKMDQIHFSQVTEACTQMLAETL